MKLLGTILLLALVACEGWRAVVPGSPDYTAPSGPRVWLDGRPGEPEAVLAIECLHGRIPSMCPEARLAPAEAHWRTLRVRWRADPFDCGPYAVHGCVFNEAEAWVSSLSTLADEAGHIAWHDCGRGWGEGRPDGGKVFYDPDFAAWVSPCRP